MTNGQSSAFLWMVLITLGLILYIGLDHGCIVIPALQSPSPAAPAPKTPPARPRGERPDAAAWTPLPSWEFFY